MKNILNKKSNYLIIKAASLIYKIATDRNLKSGGINEYDGLLRKAGYTKKEAEMIERNIKEAMIRLTKKEDALDNL